MVEGRGCEELPIPVNMEDGFAKSSSKDEGSIGDSNDAESATDEYISKSSVEGPSTA